MPAVYLNEDPEQEGGSERTLCQAVKVKSGCHVPAKKPTSWAIWLHPFAKRPPQLGLMTVYTPSQRGGESCETLI